MTAKIRTRKDNTLFGVDDKLIVSKEIYDNHVVLSEKPRKLYEKILRFKLNKCQFAKSERRWLGHKFSQCSYHAVSK